MYVVLTRTTPHDFLDGNRSMIIGVKVKNKYSYLHKETKCFKSKRMPPLLREESERVCTVNKNR